MMKNKDSRLSCSHTEMFSSGHLALLRFYWKDSRQSNLVSMPNRALMRLHICNLAITPKPHSPQFVLNKGIDSNLYVLHAFQSFSCGRLFIKYPGLGIHRNPVGLRQPSKNQSEIRNSHTQGGFTQL